jgi:hypothetical protein
MAAVPAETSRPRRGIATVDIADPFWAVVTVVFFVVGLISFAKGVVTITGLLFSAENADENQWLYGLGATAVGGLLLFGPLWAFASQSSTRSSISDYSFAVMKILMFLAGIVLFVSGVFDLIRTRSLAEDVSEGLLVVLYILTPVYLHIVRK